jgi:hypothetical protein
MFLTLRFPEETLLLRTLINNQWCKGAVVGFMKEFDKFPKSIKKAVRYIKQDAT